LSIPGEIDLVTAVAASDQAFDTVSALSVARKSGADFVLSGSISLFGNYVSSDALLFDVSQGTKVGSFSRSGNSIEELPDHIAGIAADVRGLVVLGQQPAQQQATLTYQNYSAQGGEISYLAPAAAGVVDLTLESRFDGHFSAIAAGDVDGDGNNEICVASVGSLILYRWEQGQLIKLGTMKVSPAANILGLDIVDLNGNGRSEIFVSNFHEGQGRLNSYVVEWDGASLINVAEKLPWFLNSLPSVDGNGSTLIGQQVGMNSLYSKDGLFEMVWDGSQYEPGQKLSVPPSIDIYGSAVADFMQTGSDQFAKIGNDQEVSLVAADSSVLWTSSENDFGGGLRTISIDPASIGMSIPTSGDTMLFFLKQRILSADWDKDGRQDMIIVRNKDTSSKYLTQTRVYKSGAIDVLSWEGNKMDVRWSTEQMTGFTSDYIYADVTNDGVPELVAIQVVKTSKALGLLGRTTSVLRIWGKE
ncbi:VCBS repeat-containing protein, partial [Verrucomicrobia bacterium]|nr:VCBS repeat-containing protein [Verrucomicrobiota bacterium]